MPTGGAIVQIHVGARWHRASVDIAPLAPRNRRHIHDRSIALSALAGVQGSTAFAQSAAMSAYPAEVCETKPVDALFSEVYQQLRRLAHRQRRASDGATLNTTALVHELYLRVSSNSGLAFEQPAQFFAYAAQAIRHLLCDRARARLRRQTVGAWSMLVTVDGNKSLAIASAEEALALDAALTRLAQVDARAAQTVELRYFAGLSLEQIADTLGLARRTIDRDWRFARAFLHDQLA
ncbi:MAG: sigma-70 family RNA polymerase sigma factor [Luteimonas sp.]|nr:sigma-70 family RNA polymerase sigma factor [Luteimonas sp.]